MYLILFITLILLLLLIGVIIKYKIMGKLTIINEEKEVTKPQKFDFGNSYTTKYYYNSANGDTQNEHYLPITDEYWEDIFELEKIQNNRIKFFKILEMNPILPIKDGDSRDFKNDIIAINNEVFSVNNYKIDLTNKRGDQDITLKMIAINEDGLESNPFIVNMQIKDKYTENSNNNFTVNGGENKILIPLEYCSNLYDDTGKNKEGYILEIHRFNLIKESELSIDNSKFILTYMDNDLKYDVMLQDSNSLEFLFNNNVEFGVGDVADSDVLNFHIYGEDYSNKKQGDKSYTFKFKQCTLDGSKCSQEVTAIISLKDVQCNKNTNKEPKTIIDETKLKTVIWDFTADDYNKDAWISSDRRYCDFPIDGKILIDKSVSPSSIKTYLQCGESEIIKCEGMYQYNVFFNEQDPSQFKLQIIPDNASFLGNEFMYIMTEVTDSNTGNTYLSKARLRLSDENCQLFNCDGEDMYSENNHVSNPEQCEIRHYENPYVKKDNDIFTGNFENVTKVELTPKSDEHNSDNNTSSEGSDNRESEGSDRYSETEDGSGADEDRGDEYS